MKQYLKRKKEIYQDNTSTEAEESLICEEPLSIRVQGDPYIVVMRTPGEEMAHAAGLCLGEGIIGKKDDIASMAYCGEDTNVVSVMLTGDAETDLSSISDRRGYISQTSCGLCGKTLIEDICSDFSVVLKKDRISCDKAIEYIEDLSKNQPLRDITRAVHAASIFDCEGSRLVTCEDVGRHNALDKAVGSLLLDSKLECASTLVLSSRVSYELVQKAARAQIAVILAVSRPTAIAVELAENMKIGLATLKKGRGLNIYSGRERFVF